jgi:HEAT repeat protein
MALGSLRERAAENCEVLPALLNCLKDEDNNVRRSALEALGRIGPMAVQHREVLDILLSHLTNGEWYFRVHAYEMLGILVWFRKFPAGFVALFPAIPVVKCKPSFFEIALRWFMRVEWVHSQPR